MALRQAIAMRPPERVAVAMALTLQPCRRSAGTPLSAYETVVMLQRVPDHDKSCLSFFANSLAVIVHCWKAPSGGDDGIWQFFGLTGGRASGMLAGIMIDPLKCLPRFHKELP